MKNISTFFLILFALGFTQLQGQTDVRYVKTTFHKIGNIDALTLTIEGDHKNIQHVVEEHLKKMTGDKAKHTKGHIFFPAARANEISSSTLDIYTKIDKAGSKNAPSGTITFFMSLGNESFMTPDQYQDAFENAINFLETIPLQTRIYELSLAIEEQNKTLDKAQKEHERQLRDSTGLVQTLAETKAAIEQNKVDRRNQRQTIVEETARLEEYKAMREQEERRALAPKENVQLNAKKVSTKKEKESESEGTDDGGDD